MEPVWRNLTHDDLPAWTDLLARAEAVDQTGEHYDEGDLREELDDPETGPLDRIGAFTDDTMVAFAGVRIRGEGDGELHVHGEGAVDPAWRQRGLGTHGVGWLLERARAVQAEQAPDRRCVVRVGAQLDGADQVDILERAELTAVNWSAVMRVMLDDREFAEPSWPEGVRVVPYDASWSERMHAAHNAAFADHWGFVPWSDELWRQYVTGSKSFRPELSCDPRRGDQPGRRGRLRADQRVRGLRGRDRPQGGLPRQDRRTP